MAWSIWVQPTGKPAAREWAGGATSQQDAMDDVQYLRPKLPEGLTANYDSVPRTVEKLFDWTHLVEKPVDWTKGE